MFFDSLLFDTAELLAFCKESSVSSLCEMASLM